MPRPDRARRLSARRPAHPGSLAAAALTLALLALAPAAPAAPARPSPASPRGGVDPDRLAGLAVRSIGPAAMSGRVAAVEGAAGHPDLLYVGAAAGGVWKTINGGLTWEPVFDEQPVASIGAIALCPGNPDDVWVGTGEANVRNSVSIGNGIYRSLDGGRTWKHLGLAETERIAKIALDPRDPRVAYVAALGRLWGENPERGVFKTTDGGRTWKKVLYVDEKTGAADLAIDPSNPNKLFAAMWQFRRWPWAFRSGGPGSGLYVTYDGGESWRRATPEDGLPAGELGRIGLAISRSNPEIVYALVEAAGKNAILRSDDGGRTWKTASQDNRATERPFYYAALRVDPAWPNRVYSLTSRLRVSEDSGKSFGSLGRTRDIHGDYHALWIDPDDPTHMVAGNDGGLGISRDRGETWYFPPNLPLGQFYHVAYDLDSPYHVYGGLQDNGSWRGPAAVWSQGGIRNQDWQNVGGGDGFDTRPDPQKSTRGYAMSQGGDLLRWDVETGERKPIRPPEPAPGQGEPLRFNWNAGLAVDPFEPGTIYYGSQYLHRSADRGDTWQTISPDLTTDNPDWQHQDESGGLTLDASGAENYTTIIAISPSPVERGVIWVGTDDGRVQLTRDGGKTWTSVEKNVPGVPANTWVPHIVASKFDGASAFAVFDDHRRSNFTPYVYRTDDYGKTWKSLATRDLRGYALAIEQDPVDRDLLFLGTEMGLYVSTDGGRSWLPFRHGLPAAVSVMDLAIQPREGDLIVATHGRSLYVLDDLAPLRRFDPKALAEPLHLFPAREARQHYSQQSAGAYRAGAGDFRGDNEPYGAILTYSLDFPGLPLPDSEKERARKERERAAALRAAAARTDEPAPPPGQGAKPAGQPAEDEGPGNKKDKEPKVRIVVTDAAGREVRRLEGPAKLGINRAIWDLARNAPKQPPRERFRDQEPSGPEVAPGRYDVTVSFRGQQAKGTVTVLPAPSAASQPVADWQAREEALARATRLQDTAVTAIERLRQTSKDIDDVLDRLDRRQADARRTGTTADDDRPDPLAASGRKLKRRIGELEKALWQSPDVKGLLPDRDALSRIEAATSALEATWSAPDATQRLRLDQAEAQLNQVLAEINRFFETDVAAFRQQADAGQLRLLAADGPLAVEAPKP